MRELRDPQQFLNQTQRVRLQSAFQQLQDVYSRTSPSSATTTAVCVTVTDVIPVNNEDGVLKYKPEVGEIIVGSVIEISQKRWRLISIRMQFSILMLSSMNSPDGIQRKQTATDELNMRSIFEENDVICAEVRRFQHDGSLHLQTRTQKYGKLERDQLFSVPHLVKRRKQRSHHLEKYGVDLILGCNGFVWVGEHVQPGASDGSC